MDYPYTHCNVNPHLDNSLGDALPMELKKIFGKKVHQYRRLKEWNQSRLAAKAGCSQSTVSRVESGEASDADLNTIERLANALGVSAWQLLSEDETRVITKVDAELLATVRKLARN